MSFLNRHIPGLAAALVLILFAVFTLWGYTDDLKRKLDTPPLAHYAPDLPALVQAYFHRPGEPGITRPLTALLTRHPVERIAFAILLTFQPQQKRLAAYLHDAPLGSVCGFDRAAKRYFGVSVQRLNAGETLLLCNLADTGAPIDEADSQRLLRRRDALLADMHTRGALSDEAYRTERDRALSLAADPRPIY